MTTTTLSQKKPSLSPAAVIWIGLIGVFLIIGVISAFIVLRDGLVVTNLSDSVPWG